MARIERLKDLCSMFSSYILGPVGHQLMKSLSLQLHYKFKKANLKGCVSGSLTDPVIVVSNDLFFLVSKNSAVCKCTSFGGVMLSIKEYILF